MSGESGGTERMDEKGKRANGERREWVNGERSERVNEGTVGTGERGNGGNR